MGWDGHAKGYDKKKHAEAFGKAADMVVAEAGAVDGFLRNGSLDCSSCAYALQDATGEAVWTGVPWTPETVKRLAERAIWPDEIPDGDKWAVLSAKAFLETCAEAGLGIYFSF